MRAILAGSFFDPTVDCNLVSAWIQAIFETIDPVVASEDYPSLATIISKRQPSLAALWVGAIISGFAGRILRDVRHNCSVIDLNAAGWTRTIQSFIQIPPDTSNALENGVISRSDECRYLFLTASEGRPRLSPHPPMSPWQPFGSTPLDYLDLEVRQHVICKAHCLLYQFWCWETENGLSGKDLGFDEIAATVSCDDGAGVADMTPINMQSDEFPKSEYLSEGATRVIFYWLRSDGYPPYEKGVFTHEWLDIGESTDESVGSEDSKSVEHGKPNQVEEWLDSGCSSYLEP